MRGDKPIPNLDEYDFVRFYSRVKLPDDMDACWNWEGAKDTGGYGSFSKNARNYTTHRVAYFLYHKKDPGELCVLHTCDNRACVNPKHFFLGTNYDNVLDKMAKGRQGRATGELSGPKKYPERYPKGSGIANAKLTEDNVIEMRKLYEAGGISTYELAKKYNVSQASTWYMLKRVTWKHI